MPEQFDAVAEIEGAAGQLAANAKRCAESDPASAAALLDAATRAFATLTQARLLGQVGT